MTASPSFIPTSTRSSGVSQPLKDEETGGRRRKEDSTVLAISPTSVTDGTHIQAQFHQQQSYNVWITILICGAFASVLAVICKYRVFYLYMEKKNQGEIVNSSAAKMIPDISERV